MGQIRARGYDFTCFEDGGGAPLVLVHGSVSDHRTWEHHRGVFGRHFRTIAYSRRYHWPNAEIPEGADYSMREHVEDLLAVLEAMNASPAHIVGHSYGAYVALQLAIHHPLTVRSLVLAEPPVLPLYVSVPPKPSELLRLLFRNPKAAAAIVQFGAKGMGPATAAFERGDPEGGLSVFGPAVLGEKAFEALSKSRLEQVRANLIAAEFLGSGFAGLSDTELRAVSQSTLLLHSEHSPRLFPILVARLAELMPNSELTEVALASHIMHEDNPDDFSEVVLSFLTSQRVGS